MKTFLVFFLILANSAAAATALPDAELHRLSAYLAYVVVGVDAEGPGGESIYTVGANCGECNGTSKLGDGTVVFPCEWEDGLYYCNKGKIAKKSDGDAMDYEDIGDSMCDTVCDCGNCDGKCGGGCCDNCICDTCEATPLPPEVETPLLCPDCPNCPTCSDPKPEESQEPEPTPEREEVASDVLTIYKMPGASWNWNGRRNPSTEYMRSHLETEHGLDTSGMSREQLQIIHNNAHNYGDDMALGTATYEAKSSGASSSSCPSGTCPTSSSSSSRGFGFFRR